MRLAVQTGRAEHERLFLNRLAQTCEGLGHEVERFQVERSGSFSASALVLTADACIAWNGRDVQTGGNPLICVECGWLPRWWYQVGIGGINAAHHLAGPSLRPLTAAQSTEARLFLESLRTMEPPTLAGTHLSGATTRHLFSYADPRLPPVSANVRDFILCPLQVETDTNMESVPFGLRSPQDFIDEVEAQDFEVPVVFKAHCASNAGHGDLQVSGRRNRLAFHAEGTVHQWLKHPGCRLVVTLNSNTANDALIWGVPSIVLADGIWPRKHQRGPFFYGFGGELGWYEQTFRQQSHQRTALQYVHWLRGAQWRLEDADDGERVAGLLKEARRWPKKQG